MAQYVEVGMWASEPSNRPSIATAVLLFARLLECTERACDASAAVASSAAASRGLGVDYFDGGGRDPSYFNSINGTAEGSASASGSRGTSSNCSQAAYSKRIGFGGSGTMDTDATVYGGVGGGRQDVTQRGESDASRFADATRREGRGTGGVRVSGGDGVEDVDATVAFGVRVGVVGESSLLGGDGAGDVTTFSAGSGGGGGNGCGGARVVYDDRYGDGSGAGGGDMDETRM